MCVCVCVWNYLEEEKNISKNAERCSQNQASEHHIAVWNMVRLQTKQNSNNKKLKPKLYKKVNFDWCFKICEQTVYVKHFILMPQN